MPDPRFHYPALFVPAIVVCMAFVFAFMAGDQDLWLRTPGGVAAAAGPQPPLAAAPWGPARLTAWLRFWRLTPETSMNPAYIFAWGARYAPSIAAGEWWRLFSSVCLHSSFAHLLSNMLLLVLLAVPLESTCARRARVRPRCRPTLLALQRAACPLHTHTIPRVRPPATAPSASPSSSWPLRSRAPSCP